MSAAGSAGCSSSDALLSQHLPGPRSPSSVRCPHVCPVGALSLGSPLPLLPGALGFLSCVAFVFPGERWSCRVTRIAHCRFPMGSYPGLLKLFCLFIHAGRKSGACLAGLWAVASLQMIRLLKMRNASRGISNSLPSPAALERAGGRTRALRQPAPKAVPGAERPRGGREGWRGAGHGTARALGQVLGVPSSRLPIPEPSPPRSLGSMSVVPR